MNLNHAMNLELYVRKTQSTFNKSCVVAIDASVEVWVRWWLRKYRLKKAALELWISHLGKGALFPNHVGISIREVRIALEFQDWEFQELGEVGDISITGMVGGVTIMIT